MSLRAAYFAAALFVLPVAAYADDMATPPADASQAAPAQTDPAKADAAQSQSSNPVIKACQTELTSLCATADKPGARVRCLMENKDKLGADCTAAVKDMQQKRKAMREACRDDAAKLCPDAKGGEMMACMRGQISKVSKPCSDAMAAMQTAAK